MQESSPRISLALNPGYARDALSLPPCSREACMLPSNATIVDLSLELDPKNFAMRTPAGFKKDMQFAMEVIKDFDAEGGAGQIVRGVHMRLHAGSHVDAPEHFVKGGKQIHQLPLETFLGPAVVADVRHRMPGGGITADDLEKVAGADLRDGERILLRTDCNKDYDGSAEWQKRSPYLTNDAIDWCLKKR